MPTYMGCPVTDVAKVQLTKNAGKADAVDEAAHSTIAISFFTRDPRSVWMEFIVTARKLPRQVEVDN